MDFVALVSGGKDSIYTICKLLDEGNRLVALIHLSPIEEYTDSYMYQTVGTEALELIGQCLDAPTYIFKSGCKAINTELKYTKSDGDEVEDLHNALAVVQEKHQFQGVSSGAIHSRYQKNRVEDVCMRLGLLSMAPLWERDQKELLNEMVAYGIYARVIKVASSSLGKECLGMNLKELQAHINNGKFKYEVNYCGEGGEYETLVLDCPHFKRRLVCGSYDVHDHPEDKNREDGVCYFKLGNLEIMEKAVN